MKVLAVVGTRPEAIKMAPVIHELQARPEQVEVLVCATGQHRQMLDQVLDLFGIAPDLDLNLMQQRQELNDLAARVLQAIDPVLARLRPDWLLVQGDTTTVMATAIAAHHRHIRIGHVEAGLRTFDRANPFPEEMNRVVTDHLSDYHFAPTARARQNLLREGIAEQSIHVTGNTVADALQWMIRQPLADLAHAELGHNGLLRWIEEPDASDLIVVTLHRRENHGEPIRRICRALRTIACSRPEVRIVYPVHRNPEVWEPVHELLGDVPGITLLPPVSYSTLVYLLKHSKLILTDSGGIQEEAPSLGKPVLVLRKTTERPEAQEAGAARLIGTEAAEIVAATLNLLDDHRAYEAMARAINPYGDGRAAVRIVDILLFGRAEPFVPEASRV